MKAQRVRGTRDLIGDLKKKFRFIDQTALDLAAVYGFEEIETPIFESSEVFHRSLGESSDIVHKETYTFLDRGGDSITLRPEGTAGVARAFVSEGLAQNLPLKFYYYGPMFRYERPQKGRFRQFYQLGVETLGLANPETDIESLCLANDFIQAMGPGLQTKLQINTLGDTESRLIFREKLVEYFKKYENDLSADSKLRLEKNPLRIFDSKDEGDQKIILTAPTLQKHLNDDSRKFFDQVIQGLQKLNIPFALNEKLVRGIDYYCHTVFEFTTEQLGAQSAVLAGGRYDGLIETMGGPKTPGVGWAAGVDRLAELLDISMLAKKSQLKKIALVPIDDSGIHTTLRIAQKIRAQKIRAQIYWSGNLGKRMKKADQNGDQWAFLIGGEELSKNLIVCKNLKTGEQKNQTENDLLSLIDSYTA